MEDDFLRFFYFVFCVDRTAVQVTTDKLFREMSKFHRMVINYCKSNIS